MQLLACLAAACEPGPGLLPTAANNTSRCRLHLHLPIPMPLSAPPPLCLLLPPPWSSSWRHCRPLVQGHQARRRLWRLGRPAAARLYLLPCCFGCLVCSLLRCLLHLAVLLDKQDDVPAIQPFPGPIPTLLQQAAGGEAARRRCTRSALPRRAQQAAGLRQPAGRPGPPLRHAGSGRPKVHPQHLKMRAGGAPGKECNARGGAAPGAGRLPIRLPSMRPNAPGC